VISAWCFPFSLYFLSLSHDSIESMNVFSSVKNTVFIFLGGDIVAESSMIRVEDDAVEILENCRRAPRHQ
jgi:hypothetical protein